MNILIYPKITNSTKILLWVGVLNINQIPNLQWTIKNLSNNADIPEQTPNAIKAIDSVRPPAFLTGNPLRAYSGLYEFSNCRPDNLYEITLTVNGNTTLKRQVKTLPNEIKQGKTFNVLLVSCYHKSKDPNGISGEVIDRIKPFYTPDITILMGDQVYLDLPTLKNFPDNSKWLSEKFEKDYSVNWLGPYFPVTDMNDVAGYAKILSVAPSISIPDDHEYWNNYPHKSPVVGNSYQISSRNRWSKAAEMMYKGFQLHDPNNYGMPTIVDIPPLTFFIADTRSQRDFDLKYILNPQSFAMLNTWIDRVIDKKLFGFFVSGQSLFTEKVSELKGAIEDYELPNYGDYNRIMEALQRATENGQRITCITGDVHWGRIVHAYKSGEILPNFIEIITSPSSLVETVGKDQWSGLKSFAKGIFGISDSWPRHSDGDIVPEKIFGMNCSTIHRQKGNQVCILSFTKNGDGLDCKVIYFPIHEETKINNNITEIDLPYYLNR